MFAFAERPKAPLRPSHDFLARRSGDDRESGPSRKIGTDFPGQGPNAASFKIDLTQIPARAASSGNKQSEGVPLRPDTRSRMEASFGESLHDVRLHSGPAAHRSARAFGARAYAIGSDIVLGDQVSPSHINQRRSPLLAHELTHVLQHRRTGKCPAVDRVERTGSAAEQEAARNGMLTSLGLPVGRVAAAANGIALTPTSKSVEYDLSYAWNDWSVTEAEEKRIVDVLERDSDLSATIKDLKAEGMLAELFDRIDVPSLRRRLLQALGRGLDTWATALVVPHVSKLGSGAELQFNLGKFGVTSSAPAFNPAAHTAALVGTARTSRAGHTGGHLTSPFTGVGATGVIPVTKYVGTFHSTPGVPQIPVEDQVLLAAKHKATEATYSNPLGNLRTYLSGLSSTQRTQQAELLLKRPIATVEEASYQGKLPSRAQVIKGAATAHNLHGALIAAFILAEQRDQSQAEDAKDYQAATSILAGNTSIGLGQVVVSTALKEDLFADLVNAPSRRTGRLNDASSGMGKYGAANLLASDEYNIFAVARYIRKVADQGSRISLSSLPNTAAAYPAIDLPAYAGNSSTWPADNIRALGSEYTSTAWDDSLRTAWGDFVYEAYLDVVSTGLF